MWENLQLSKKERARRKTLTLWVTIALLGASFALLYASNVAEREYSEAGERRLAFSVFPDRCVAIPTLTPLFVFPCPPCTTVPDPHRARAGVAATSARNREEINTTLGIPTASKRYLVVFKFSKTRPVLHVSILFLPSPKLKTPFAPHTHPPRCPHTLASLCLSRPERPTVPRHRPGRARPSRRDSLHRKLRAGGRRLRRGRHLGHAGGLTVPGAAHAAALWCDNGGRRVVLGIQNSAEAHLEDVGHSASAVLFVPAGDRGGKGERKC